GGSIGRGARPSARGPASMRATGDTMTRLVLGILAWVLSAASASAGPAFSGEDAAYIDWGAKNCATKSTDKEHTIVDEANAKDSAGFLRKYQGKDLSDA